MSDPSKPTPLVAPPRLCEEYRQWTWNLHWQMVQQSSTWRIEHAGGRVRFVKVSQSMWPYSPLEDGRRMRWAASHLPVPAVVDMGVDEDLEWLVTEALPGVDATVHELRSDPETLVPVLAQALRSFHDAAPPDRCPFDFRLDAALARARSNVDAGHVDPADFHTEHSQHTPTSALNLLERSRPPSEDLVVCHGDYCLPNVLIDDDRVTGYVDLGMLGISDRWRDLAVGAWSVTRNLGPGLEDLFYSSYGIEPDPARIDFFRLLYELT